MNDFCMPCLVVGAVFCAALNFFLIDNTVSPSQWAVAQERCAAYGGVREVKGTIIDGDVAYMCADGSTGDVHRQIEMKHPEGIRQ